MKKIISVALLICTIHISMAQNPGVKPDKRLKGIDKELEQMRKDWGAAGFAVAVVEKDRIIYSSGFGYRDVNAKTPVTPNTLFAIGSSTKAFTAALIGQLEEEGKLELDDRPSKYLPQLEFFTKEMDRQITIRDILSHRTGLPRHDLSWYLFPSDSREELLARIAYHEPVDELRNQWQYNNFMYTLAGAVTESVTGESWDTQIMAQIFEPLGMSRSTTKLQEFLQQDDISKGYETRPGNDIRELDYYEIAGMSPAGSISSSVTDMSQWLISWINGGKYRGEEVFSEDFYNEATNPQMAITGSPGKQHPDVHSLTYGLGWFLSSYRGHYRAEHGGNIDGFSSSVAFFPSDSIGIVVLVNQNHSALPGIIRNTVIDRVLDLERVEWSEEKLQASRKPKSVNEEADTTEAVDPVRKLNTSPSHQLSAYAGKYQHKGYGTFEILVSGDSLLAHTPLHRLWLKHYHYDVFEALKLKAGEEPEELGLSKFNFQTSDAGEISALELFVQSGLEPLKFERIEEEKVLAENELLVFAGHYDMQGMTVKVFLKEEAHLFMEVPGQPEYELIAVGNGKFNIVDLEGYALRFVLAESGDVSSLLFLQPNGTFEAKRKD